MSLVVASVAQVEVTTTGVGVGTSTPGASLDVQIPGNTLGVRIQNDAATTARLLAVSAGNSAWSNGNGVAQFTVGSATSTGRVVSIVNNGTGDSLHINHAGASGNGLIVTGGNVGIGTTSPAAALHAKGKSGQQISGRFEYQGGMNFLDLVTANGGGNYGSAIRFIDSGVTNAQIISLANSHLVFFTGSNNTPNLSLLSNGSVGIGTTNTPTHKLQVVGTVRATSFISDTTTYADFVFKPGYRLAPLSEVEAHIAEHGHLPDVPSEAQVAKEGIDLAAMQVKLLQKIEEITLHQIAQSKDIAALKEENARLRRQFSGLTLQP